MIFSTTLYSSRTRGSSQKSRKPVREKGGQKEQGKHFGRVSSEIRPGRHEKSRGRGALHNLLRTETDAYSVARVCRAKLND